MHFTSTHIYVTHLLCQCRNFSITFSHQLGLSALLTTLRTKTSRLPIINYESFKYSVKIGNIYNVPTKLKGTKLSLWKNTKPQYWKVRLLSKRQLSKKECVRGYTGSPERPEERWPPDPGGGTGRPVGSCSRLWGHSPQGDRRVCEGAKRGRRGSQTGSVVTPTHQEVRPGSSWEGPSPQGTLTTALQACGPRGRSTHCHISSQTCCHGQQGGRCHPEFCVSYTWNEWEMEDERWHFTLHL